MDAFLLNLSSLPPQSEDNVFENIWKQYERVILESLLSAFMLDFMIRDQHGGDVDTLNNVGQIGVDPRMEYKNSFNKGAYDRRGEYSHKDVEGSGTNYQKIKHEARKSYNADNRKTVIDEYSGGTLGFFGKSKNRPTDKNANLDHVVSAKNIHDDRRRVLSGLSTKDLADKEENLAWTSEHLNKSLGRTDNDEYIEMHTELDETTKANMREKNRIAKESMEKSVFQAYYLDPSNPNCRRFYADATVAAGKLGVKMGIRQVLGFFFVEVYIVTKQEVQSLESGCDFSEIIRALIVGVKKGFESATSKYKELFSKFAEGFASGAFASLCTTLCNIFASTGKFFVKNIREITASVVRSARVLLLNPDDLELGERFKMSAVILATGASILVGSYIGVKLAETPIAEIPVIGNIIIRFCSTFISGLLSCTFLIYMDRSRFINAIINALNAVPSEVTGMKELSAYLEQYAAELNEVDIDKFRRDSERFQDGAERVIHAKNEDELSIVLSDLFKDLKLPWKGDFDYFMGNRNNHLVFE